ncbi:unnamed protein product, partial [Symbiodinium sp. KB8]
MKNVLECGYGSVDLRKWLQSQIWFTASALMWNPPLASLFLDAVMARFVEQGELDLPQYMQTSLLREAWGRGMWEADWLSVSSLSNRDYLQSQTIDGAAWLYHLLREGSQQIRLFWVGTYLLYAPGNFACLRCGIAEVNDVARIYVVPLSQASMEIPLDVALCLCDSLKCADDTCVSTVSWLLVQHAYSAGVKEKLSQSQCDGLWHKEAGRLSITGLREILLSFAVVCVLRPEQNPPRLRRPWEAPAKKSEPPPEPTRADVLGQMNAELAQAKTWQEEFAAVSKLVHGAVTLEEAHGTTIGRQVTRLSQHGSFNAKNVANQLLRSWLAQRQDWRETGRCALVPLSFRQAVLAATVLSGWPQQQQRQQQLQQSAKKTRKENSQVGAGLLSRMVGLQTGRATILHVCALHVASYMVRRWLLSEGVLELGVVDDIRIGKGSRQSFHVPKCYGLARRCSTWSIFVISALLHCCCAGSKTSLRTSTFVKWLMFSTPPLSLASDEDANKAEDWRRKYNHLLRRSVSVEQLFQLLQLQPLELMRQDWLRQVSPERYDTPEICVRMTQRSVCKTMQVLRAAASGLELGRWRRRRQLQDGLQLCYDPGFVRKADVLKSLTSKKRRGTKRKHFCEFKVKFDKSRLFELYEDSLLGLKELTEHQKVKLKEMEGLDN